MSEFLENRLQHRERLRWLAQEYGPIVVAAGYPPGFVSPEEALLLAGAIHHRLSPAPEKFVRHLGGCVVETDIIGLLNSMTDAQRAALRDSINFLPSHR